MPGLERVLVGQVAAQRGRVLEPGTRAAADVAKLVAVARQDVESNWGRRTHQEADLSKDQRTRFKKTFRELQQNANVTF